MKTEDEDIANTCASLELIKQKLKKIHLVKPICVDKVRSKNKVVFISQGEDRV